MRVRLSGGLTKQRRFVLEGTVADVRHWVGTLEELPLAPGPPPRLMTSYPRAVPESEMTVRELAAGASAVALFVEVD